MSKIGKKTIILPKDSSIDINGNQLTVKGPKGTKILTFNDKILHQGIILRYLGGWGLPDCVRVRIGNNEENEYLINRLYEIIPNSI